MRSPSVVIMMNSRNNNESGSSSRSSRESADAEAAGSHQQVGDGGLPDISDVDIDGIFYEERLKTFRDNNWPFDSTLEGTTCYPEALAMAGLKFMRMDTPSAQCFACDAVIENLEADSDPWVLHQAQEQSCPYIQLGKREHHRDYTFDEMLDIYNDKIVKLHMRAYVETEKHLKDQLEYYAKVELEEDAEH